MKPLDSYNTQSNIPVTWMEHGVKVARPQRAPGLELAPRLCPLRPSVNAPRKIVRKLGLD